MDCSPILALLAICTPVPDGPPKALPLADEKPAAVCMTKEQARAKYPKAWLYWHGASHCWDNIPGRRSSTARSEPIPISKPPAPSVASGSKQPNSDQRPSHEIIYPVLRNSLGVGPEMLTAYELTHWPLLIDLDEMFDTPPDPDNGIDGCCWPKLETLDETQNQQIATDHVRQTGKGGRWRR